MSTIAAVWRFTFESFLVKDDGVVLWCLRQAEKLTTETTVKETYIIHFVASKTILDDLIWVTGKHRRVSRSVWGQDQSIVCSKCRVTRQTRVSPWLPTAAFTEGTRQHPSHAGHLS